MADSFLTCYQQYGDRRLSRGSCDQYVAPAAVVPERLGVIDPPMTQAQLPAEVEAYRPELACTPAAKDAARFLLLSPPLPPAARSGYALLAAGAVASLPPWARQLLGIPVLGLADAWVGRPLGRLAAATVRWAMSDRTFARDRLSAADHRPA